MTSVTTEQTPLGELHYLLWNHLDLVETAAILKGGRINQEVARKLAKSAAQVVESGSALQLAMKPFQRTDEASRLYHSVLRAAWPKDSPWKEGECQLGPDYVASVKGAIREVEELALLVADNTVPDSREERSEHMTLSEMMKRLGLAKDERTFQSWGEQYGLRKQHNRQNWSIKLDDLPQVYRKRWDEYEDRQD